MHAFIALNDKKIVTFLLTCPKEIRKERMFKRGDDKVKIEERLKNDEIDFAPSRIGKVNFEINTQNKSIDEVIDTVYKLYKDYLSTNI